MRKTLTAGFISIMALAAILSCNRSYVLPENDPRVQNKEIADPDGVFASGYYAHALVTVPAGTKKLYLRYTTADNKISEKAIDVDPAKISFDHDAAMDIQPMGSISVEVKAGTKTRVSIFYTMPGPGPGTKANVKGNAEEYIPAIENLPVDRPISGEFGTFRYVQFNWSYAYYMTQAVAPDWRSVEMKRHTVGSDYCEVRKNATFTYKDGKEYTQWLTYRFAYEGPDGAAYYLTDAYDFQQKSDSNHQMYYIVSGEKAGYNYCGGGCGNCGKCMPWGCWCGCGGWENGQPKTKWNDRWVPAAAPSGQPEENIPDNSQTEDPDTPVFDLTDTEVAPYVTTDNGRTSYHSSGSVLFNESWPVPVRFTDSDYNDVVLDYDLEAKTVDIANFPDEAWKEQLKVVLHLRAVGGDWPQSVGIILEGFDTENVEWTEEYVTLDSWQNQHGILPSWVNGPQTAGKWEPTPNGQMRFSLNKDNATRPVITIGNLQALRSIEAGSEHYTYQRDKDTPAHDAVFNWKNAGKFDINQFSASLANPYDGKNFYNTVPGRVNVNGGLITYTVIFFMKERTGLTEAKGKAQLENLTSIVQTTTNQNFFVVANHGGNENSQYEIHLKGYQPSDGFAATYRSVTAAGSSSLSQDATYTTPGRDAVWAIKSPVLTRHAWENCKFSLAYPEYLGWLKSNGANNATWYLNGEDAYLSCWW